MTTELVYFAVTLVLTTAVAGSLMVVMWTGGQVYHSVLGGWARWGPIAAAVLAMAAIAIALRVDAVAEADGRIVEKLAEARAPGLDDVFSLVTRMGDVIPSYTIAAALAIALMVSTRRLLTPWLLILVVVIEIALQFLLADHVFENVTIDVVEPMVPLDGAGSNPSGATARLFTLFLVAAAICRPDHQRAARAFLVAGAVITLVEVISRLYLGRHLILDIFGGLFLGLVLTISAAAVVAALAPLERRLAGRVTW